MSDMNLFPMINGAATKISHSALPDSPVIPDRAPGRLRARTAHVLRSVATSLDGDITLAPGPRRR
jgi:hypothetical protein